MKRTISAVNFICLFGISSLLYAAAPSGFVNQPITPEAKFEISGSALFFQPSSTLLDYAVYGFPFPTQSPHWKVSSVRPGFSPGFDIAGRYYIPCSDYDLHLSWDHLRTSNSDTTQAGPNQFVVVMFQAGPSAGQILNNPSTHAKANAKFYYDVVNLDIGRYFTYSDNTQVRLYAGISGVQLKQNLSTTFRDNAATYSINLTTNSKFTGYGPLLGIDGNYQFPCTGFGAFASMTVSGLIGTQDPLTSFTSSSPELTSSGISSNYQTISPSNSTQVVPAFDGSIGVNYAFGFSDAVLFRVAIGYEYADYLNSVVAYTPSTVFGNINTGTIALSSLGKSVSNFSVQGPFINVAMRFI